MFTTRRKLRIEELDKHISIVNNRINDLRSRIMDDQKKIFNKEGLHNSLSAGELILKHLSQKRSSYGESKER